jgi:phage terminase small subunit
VADQATLQQAFETALNELKGKERRLVVEYLRDLHQRNAAIRAGYSAHTADVQASQILRKLKVRAAINAGMALYAMPAPEVLYRLTEHAETSADDFLTIERVMRRDILAVEKTNDAGEKKVEFVDGPEYEVLETRLDLEKAKDRGKLHLLKEYKVDKDGAVSVKWHDSQTALIAIGKHHGLFVEKIDISRQELEAFFDILKHNLSEEEYARIVALAARAGAPRS